MKDTTRKAYTEVIELLKYFPYEDVKKIPEQKIKIFLVFRDKDYKYKVNIEKNFEEQEMLPETRAIFTILYEDYWASEDEKRKLRQKEIEAKQVLEEERKRKYSPDTLFKNKKYPKVEEHLKNANLSLRKEDIFTKIGRLLRNLFKRK